MLKNRFAWLMCLAGLGWQMDVAARAADPPQVAESDVYVSGEGGYHTYRIPAIVKTKASTLLAFCEGRKNSRSDAGDIDLLLRRSTDGGRTWAPPQVVWDDGPNTCGNPCPVVDQETGIVWMLLTWNAGQISERGIQPGYGENSRRVFVTHSPDDGRTWSRPEEITRRTKDEAWSWYATGPGAGIQLTRGTQRGRLVIPCDHKLPTQAGEQYRSHVVYSDDHGATWQRGGSAPQDQVNECEVVELVDGRLLLNMRTYDKRVPARQVCFSDDGGQTWRDQRHDETLIEPICQASIRRLRWPRGDRPGVVLFSNPASTTKRVQMTIRASYDEGRSWRHTRVLYPGGSAYSCLSALDETTVGCLYEKDGYQRITFARFPLAWIESAP